MELGIGAGAKHIRIGEDLDAVRLLQQGSDALPANQAIGAYHNIHR